MSTDNAIVHDLANPVEHRVMVSVSQESFKDVTLLTSGGFYGDDCTTFYTYQADPRRYDSGYLIAVYYERNEEEDDCIENTFLSEDQRMSSEYFHEHVLSDLKLSHPLTWVKYRTVDGRPTISYDSPEDHAITYPPLPAVEGIPTIPITAISKLNYKFCHFTLNIIKYDDTLYAFHHFGEPHRSLFEDEKDDGKLLEGVQWLTRFDSPYIAKVSHLVTDASGCFRGYLLSFCPGGNMHDVLDDSHSITNDDRVSAREDKYDQPLVPESLELVFPLKGTSYTKLIPWAVKMRWAVEILSGVVALHAAGCFTGDLKLQNVVLTPDGHMLLIDITPVPNGYTEEYVPPEIDVLSPPADDDDDMEAEGDPTFPLTAARDVFDVGLMLWQLSEEVGWFLRHDIRYAPRLHWTEGDGAAPAWYRELAESCVKGDPEARPTAALVLEVLNEYRGLGN